MIPNPKKYSFQMSCWQHHQRRWHKTFTLMCKLSKVHKRKYTNPQSTKNIHSKCQEHHYESQILLTSVAIWKKRVVTEFPEYFIKIGLVWKCQVKFPSFHISHKYAKLSCTRVHISCCRILNWIDFAIVHEDGKMRLFPW